MGTLLAFGVEIQVMRVIWHTSGPTAYLLGTFLNTTSCADFNPYLGLLALGEALVVTPDSISMVSGEIFAQMWLGFTLETDCKRPICGRGHRSKQAGFRARCRAVWWEIQPFPFQLAPFRLYIAVGQTPLPQDLGR
jgi:hypothetical protein